MTLRENELILQYLRNITAKMTVLFERMEALTKVTTALGVACGTAFNQTKEVVQKLAEVTEETRMDLSEYGGTIEAASFF